MKYRVLTSTSRIVISTFAMKKQFVAIASIIALFAFVLCGCGKSSTLAQERSIAERESSGTSIQTTESTASIQAEKSEVDILSSVGSTNTPAVTNEKSDLQESDEKERIVWVKDTEIERNMKTGEIVTWQHEIKLDRNGFIDEDYSTDSDGNIKILLYRYDNNGNCTWECQVDSSGYVNGQLREYERPRKSLCNRRNMTV